MIVDVCAFAGHWPTHPSGADLPEVRESLRGLGVERMFISPLEAAWCRNPHQFNAGLCAAAEPFSDVSPVPVLDPTVATWRDELARVAAQPRVRLVRLLPAYGPYPLTAANALCEALTTHHLGVIVQTRLEDPRRQHPLAQVPDVPAGEVADLAARHSNLTVIIGGARTAELRQLRGRLADLPNLYADTSQADGFDALRSLVEAGLTAKLLFGSHAPLFVPLAGLARVTTDLDDAAAGAILGSNAAQMLR